ncbi:REP-associated tyrosine transposase [Pseudooceanicola onchidii]|uniref:REP-associated tyrosine transposase n=1 Tax=Pseudooceanicola onchidii TaxID=2562279 RepID=UPI0010A9C4F3|nr:transposase [Pseudooceanicola onchidii]
MPRYIRPRHSGATIFCTLCLADRRSGLLTQNIDRLRSAVLATLLDRPVTVDAWVVLPDHMHFVWTLPERDEAYSIRIAAMKARFSRAMLTAGFIPPPVGRCKGGVNPALRRKGEIGLWQPRFWEHHIRDQADYQAHVRYCWGNPVKHGLARRPVDWPYSSIHRDIRRGLVEAEWSADVPEGAFGE